MFMIAQLNPSPPKKKKNSKLVDKKTKKRVGFRSLWDVGFDNKFHEVRSDWCQLPVHSDLELEPNTFIHAVPLPSSFYLLIQTLATLRCVKSKQESVPTGSRLCATA